MNYNSRFEQIKRNFKNDEPVDSMDIQFLIELVDEYHDLLEDAYLHIDKIEDKLEDLYKRNGYN